MVKLEYDDQVYKDYSKFCLEVLNQTKIRLQQFNKGKGWAHNAILAIGASIKLLNFGEPVYVTVLALIISIGVSGAILSLTLGTALTVASPFVMGAILGAGIVTVVSTLKIIGKNRDSKVTALSFKENVYDYYQNDYSVLQSNHPNLVKDESYTQEIEKMLICALKRFIDTLRNDIPMSDKEYEAIIKTIK